MGNKNSILSFLGIGKSPQDELSSLVMDSLSGYSGLSDTDKKARRDKVNNFIESLTDSPEKKVLVDTVKDCFDFPKEVLENSEKVKKGLDSVYKLCISSETAALQATLDSIKKESEEEEVKDSEKEDEKKKGKESEEKEEETKDADAEKEKDKKKKEDTKDSFDLEKVIEAVVTRVTDSLGTKIDEAVKKQLGMEVKGAGETKDSILPSLSSEENDGSFLLNNMFM